MGQSNAFHDQVYPFKRQDKNFNDEAKTRLYKDQDKVFKARPIKLNLSFVDFP